MLRSYPRGGGGGFFSDRFSGRDDTMDVLALRADETLAPSPAVPSTLAPLERLDGATAVEDRRIELSGTSINGQDMDLARVDAVVTAGTTELWEVRNVDGQAHNFHIHDVQFQVLDVDGDRPTGTLAGWKDTVEVRAGETIRLLVPFGTHVDPDVPYMFHCHLLRHEDRGMMGQFVVVAPGDEAPGSIDVDEHADH